MFGVTTPAVTAARTDLEDRGYEVLVFHCTGTGGKAMENLIEAGFFDGVLDLTTTELCDELVGGVLSAGPDRMGAAARTGVPQVVSLGALDMVNFGAPDTVPDKFEGRTMYEHNPFGDPDANHPGGVRRVGTSDRREALGSDRPDHPLHPAERGLDDRRRGPTLLRPRR